MAGCPRARSHGKRCSTTARGFFKFFKLFLRYMPELSVFFHRRASQQPHNCLGFAKECVGAWRRWRGHCAGAALSHGHAPPLFLANVHRVKFITYLSYLLTFALLSLPQNGSSPKPCSDAADVWHTASSSVEMTDFEQVEHNT